ncbi:hypothetical protein [Pelagibius sp.]|uniref:hypothetical protein n=1 Tax=Pelagibius sp. TaxID=1931238 RepID=UPI00260A9CD9|nr:hypothetical protein [Pelagibius sp.]
MPRPGNLCRSLPFPLLVLAPFVLTLSVFAGPVPTAAAALAERLVGSWTCQGQETGLAEPTEMTLRYRTRGGWVLGEMVQENGEILLDIWRRAPSHDFTDRRILSHDATMEMELRDVTGDHLNLEGEIRHVLGDAAPIREALRFAGNDRFDAIWEMETDGRWTQILTRVCTRSR